MRQYIETGQFYHIYNRGVDKRNIFGEQYDVQRFLQSMREFNVLDPIGSIYENAYPLGGPTPKLIGADRLVNVLSYCLNPNHFHLILEQLVEGGVSEFMKRLGGGYTTYFNVKNRRTGSLFQGKYKYVHIDSDSYLKHLSVYVNLNDRVHQLGGPTPKLVKSSSSFGQYVGEEPDEYAYIVENKEMILSHFKSGEDYKKYAFETLPEIVRNKEEYKALILE